MELESSISWKIGHFFRARKVTFWNIKKFFRVSCSWNIRMFRFLKYKEILRSFHFWNIRKSFLLWKYKKFLLGFHFLNKKYSSIYKEYSFDKIYIYFLTLELKSSIFLEYKKFSWGGIFYFIFWAGTETCARLLHITLLYNPVKDDVWAFYVEIFRENS